MKQNTIKLPTLKEIESDLFKTLQETFSEVLEELLTGYDREIAEQRDKGRYQLKDKRAIQMDTLFGSVSIKRNYYLDLFQLSEITIGIVSATNMSIY